MEKCKLHFLIVVYIGFFLIPEASQAGPIFVDSDGCNKTYTGSVGIFSSPSDITEDTFFEPKLCNWRILARPHDQITLHIITHMPPSLNCSQAHVEVKDGYSSANLGKYCGVSLVGPIVSLSNQILISYESTSPDLGFVAYYETSCGREVHIEKPYLLEYFEDEKYDLDRECTWKFFAPEGHRLVVKFHQFKLDLDDYYDCTYDYVEVGPISNGNSTSILCKDKLSADIISTSNHLMIKYVSDRSGETQGLSAIVMVENDECFLHGCAHHCINTTKGYQCTCENGYELHSDRKNCERMCGKTFYEAHGAISSPSSDLYPPNKTCIWEIITTPDHLIGLKFHNFGIETQNISSNISPTCQQNMLEVFSKIGENQTKHHDLICRKEEDEIILPDPIISYGNAMKILFTTGSTEQNKVFRLEYFTYLDNCKILNGNCFHHCDNAASGFRNCSCGEGFVLQDNGLDCKKDECQYEITSSSGLINSLNYPANYPVDKLCSWRFRTSPGHRVRITFHDFKIENHRRCYYDYVALYDGSFTNSSHLGTFCGSTLPRTIISSGHELYMIFNSDYSVVFRGFKATYDSICGGTFQAKTEEKYIFSHAEYGSSDYDNDVNCDWTIVPTAGYNTSLTIKDLQLESDYYCNYGFVEILEGDNSLGKFCGRSTISKVFLSNTTFSIRFSSAHMSTDRGFIIIYKAV